MTACPTPGALVEIEIDRVLTQYRESPHLLGLMRNLLGEIDDAIQSICAMPEAFDIENATGDQLTLIGKRLGFPRCHCVCAIPPVFGFCAATYVGPYVIAGFCDDGSTWADCDDVGNQIVCIDDDEMYRGFLYARRYQMMNFYDAASLLEAVQFVWGEDAFFRSLSPGQVVIGPGRALTATEVQFIPLVFRVMPIAPGIKALISREVGPIFGFGTGFFGFCENANWLCPAEPYTYTCI